MEFDIDSLLEEFEIEVYRSQIYEVLKPCVYLVKSKFGCGEGEFRTKSGGKPDLPIEFEWPVVGNVPLWFLAQINLSDIGIGLDQTPLPKKGLLSFFYHDDGGECGKGSKVFYFPEFDNLRPTEICLDQRYESEFEHYHESGLDVKCGVSLPYEQHPDDPLYTYDIKLNDDDVYDDFLYEFKRAQVSSGFHQLLGYPQHMWNDALIDAYVSNSDCADFNGYQKALSTKSKEEREAMLVDARDWMLLMQFKPSDGHIYYLIRRSDLIVGNFDKIHVVEEI